MTKGGKNARTGIDRLEAHGRLRKAKAFHLVARESIGILRDAGLDRAPVLSNAILAAIAYTDGRDHRFGRQGEPKGPCNGACGAAGVRGPRAARGNL